MVTVKCYGTERVYKSKDEAINDFWEGVLMSEGSEQSRYIRIIIQLEAGKNYVTDEE